MTSSPLADQVTTLRERTLTELAECQQYVADTRRAWRLVQYLAESGRQAGVMTTAGESIADLAALAGKSQGYITEALVESAFQQSLAIFEAFVADLLAAWHVAYPKALGERQVLLKEVLAGDRDAVILAKVAEVVNEVMYGPPAKWFGWLEGYARLGCPTVSQVARFAEAKACRDLLVHNRGVANKTYLEKSGQLARHREGQRIEVPEPYRAEVWELIRQMTTDICNAASAKLAPDLPLPPPPG